MDIKEGRRAWKQTWSLRTGDTLTGDFWFVEHFEDTEKEPEEKLASISIPVAGVTDELPFQQAAQTLFPPVDHIGDLLQAFSHNLGSLLVAHALKISQIKCLPIIRV